MLSICRRTRLIVGNSRQIIFAKPAANMLQRIHTGLLRGFSVARDDLSKSPIDVGIGLNGRGGGEPFRAVFDYVRFASPSISDDCHVEDLDTVSPQEPPLNIRSLSDEFHCSDATLDSCAVALFGWTEHYPICTKMLLFRTDHLSFDPEFPFFGMFGSIPFMAAWFPKQFRVVTTFLSRSKKYAPGK